MGDQNQEAIIIAKSPEQQQHQAIMDPNNTCILSHATCTTPIYCCCYSNTSMKRRSPPPSSSATATDEDLRACKKLNFREQQQHGLTLNGVSTSTTPFHSSSYLMSPLSPSVKGFLSHPSPSPRKEKASNSMRLRRMKECLREMNKCWEEVMREEEIEEQLEDDYNEPEGVEGDKELSKDDECGRDAEEAVKVEWADKCLSICFKCPCTKGYQILLSGNNCYYKLV